MLQFNVHRYIIQYAKWCKVMSECIVCKFQVSSILYQYLHRKGIEGRGFFFSFVCADVENENERNGYDVWTVIPLA